MEVGGGQQRMAFLSRWLKMMKDYRQPPKKNEIETDRIGVALVVVGGRRETSAESAEIAYQAERSPVSISDGMVAGKNYRTIRYGAIEEDGMPR